VTDPPAGETARWIAAAVATRKRYVRREPQGRMDPREAEPGVETEPLERRLERFVRRNFPQIELHGGSAGIDAVDEGTGEVWLTLAGACSGCGISPMTIHALEARMVSEFDEVRAVHASTGYGAEPDGRPDLSDVPF
jgi:Fe-S cluster biogenesis protein NfuA